MKRTLFAFLFLFPVLLSAQFRIVGTGLFTTVNDSTYRAKIDFRPDLTGFSYNPTQMNDSMYVLSQRGQLYRLDSFYNATFSSAFIVVVEKNGNWGSPVGQVMVFQNNSSLAAPQAVYGANGATAGMQAGVDTWNALLLKVVADSASYWNEAYSSIVDSIWFSGITTKTLNMAQRGGDTLSASFVITGGADSLYVAENSGTTLLTNGDTLDLTDYPTMPFDSVTFNINEGDASERELKYSAEKGYLQYGGLDSVQIPLLPGIWYVRNDDSVTVSKGMVVRASGTLGASGRIKVKRMIANGSIPAMYVLGIAMHDIAVGADGYVMTQGKIRQVNTTAYSEGAILYADVDTLGGLTQTEPGNGYLKLPIAFVVHSASNGVLAVRVDPGSSLRDLHDVDTTGRVNGSVLRYDTALNYWKASTTAGIVAGDTSVFARDFQVSGNAGYLSKFTTDTTVGNSVVYESSSKIGIGTASPGFKLSVLGADSCCGTPRISAQFRDGLNSAFYVAHTGPHPTPGYATLLGSSDDLAFGQIQSGGTSEYMRIKATTGRVGIGTTTPARSLHVEGEARISDLTTDTPTRIVGADADGDLGEITLGTGLSIASGTLNGPSVSGTTNYLPKFTGASSVGNSPLYNVSNNKLLIGTTSGNSLKNNIEIHAAAITDALEQPSVDVYLNNSGIGIHTPYFQLYRSGGSTVNSFSRVGNGWWLGRLTFQGADGAKYVRGAQIYAITDATTGLDSMPTALRFATNPGNLSEPADRMSITSAGRVGIGTTTPDARLNVINTNSTVPALNIVGNTNVNGVDYNAVNVDMSTVGVNGTYTGINVFQSASSDGSNIGYKTSVNARNSAYGVYSTATKIWPGGALLGEAVGVYGSATTTSGLGFSYGGKFENLATSGTGYGLYVNTTSAVSGSVTPFAVAHKGTVRTVIDTVGRVGIGTISPARSLHVAATDAIRIPAGTNAQQTGGDAGDLRLNTDDSNLRFYDNTGWRAVMQSSNTVGRGTAGRVFYADAGGRVAGDEPLYWDATNNRLGINQATPTAPLDVVGGARFTQTVEALNFTGASIANGTTANNVFSISGNTAASGNTAGNANIAFNVGNSAGTRAMTILNNGRVGIGTATPSEVLEVNGTARATRLAVNTFPSQVLPINNYAPTGSLGNNLFLGNGGASSAYNVGISAYSGAYNTGMGQGSLLSVTTGYFNFGLGTEALKSLTTGNNNTVIGTQALDLATNPVLNIAIGTEAMRYNNGSANVAIGTRALRDNTTGVDNVAIGNDVLRTGNTTGNIAIGAGNLKDSKKDANIAIGRYAMISDTSGEENVAIGASALRYQLSGYLNTAIGVLAGAVDGAYNYNTTNNNSIYIGWRSKSSANGNTNEIVIGNDATGKGSNTTTIGNGSTVGTYFQYGETYIGTATDNGAFKLQVDGGARIDDEIRYTNRPAAAAVTNIGVDANGIIREATSSQRFKYNISPYEKGLADIMRLTPKWYTYNGDTKANAGFIAEDVNDAGLSEYVVYDNENKPYSLQYGNMVALLTKAIQEQQAQIEALKKEIEQLKNK